MGDVIAREEMSRGLNERLGTLKHADWNGGRGSIIHWNNFRAILKRGKKTELKRKHNKQLEGTGKHRDKTAGNLEEHCHRKRYREGVLFQDHDGHRTLLLWMKEILHAQRTDEARLQPSNRHQSVHHDFALFPNPTGYDTLTPDSFPRNLFQTGMWMAPYGSCWFRL